jgi:hypothetical protein
MRWWTRLPALLLVAVALSQHWLVRHEQLSPWLGGGFGMFASTDVWARRHLHAVAISPGARRDLAVPRALREELRKALGMPSEARLRALACRLERTLPPAERARVEALALTVYAKRYDPRTLAPQGVPLRSLRAAPCGDAS